MKYQAVARFLREFNALPVEHRRRFRELVPAFNAACEAYIADPGTPWPASLRIKPMVSAKGIWEMTWSFSGPDGRATFEFVVIDGEPGVRWRRIGNHEVYREP